MRLSKSYFLFYSSCCCCCFAAHLQLLLLQSKLPGGSWINSSSVLRARIPICWLRPVVVFQRNGTWSTEWLFTPTRTAKWWEHSARGGSWKKSDWCSVSGCWRFVIPWNDLLGNLYCVNYHQISFGIVSSVLLMLLVLLLKSDSVEHHSQHHVNKKWKIPVKSLFNAGELSLTSLALFFVLFCFLAWLYCPF